VIARFVVSEEDYPDTYGRHEGEAVRQPGLARFTNETVSVGTLTDYVTLQITATIYNDLEAALSI
jgi:hypothetical protein